MAVREQTSQQLWGGETSKAVENFPVSGERVPLPMNHWLAPIKAAAARVNADLGRLERALAAKADEFADIVKSGRTHLMDAVPVTLGQEFGGYAAQVRLGRARIETALPRVAQIPLGGTATGTGLNTHPEFAQRVREMLARD